MGGASYLGYSIDSGPYTLNSIRDDVLNGTAGNDIIADRGGGRTLNGLDGNDLLFGNGDNDTLNGGAGADLLVGGAGNDIYIFASTAEVAGDNIVEAAGDGNADTIRTTATADLSALLVNGFADLEGPGVDEGVERILIQSGTTATFSGAQLTDNTIAINESGTGTTHLVINVASGATNTFAGLTFAAFAGAGTGFDTSGDTDTVTINGAAGAETITGTSFADTIDGGAGNDSITGGAGIDTLTGGDGDDKFVYTTAATLFSGTALVDSITGGNGTDDAIVVDASVAAFTIGATVSFSAGISGVESIKAAGAATNVISVTLNDNAYEAGIHTVDLSADTNATGNNVINVSAESTAANGYTLIGSSGIDTITGGAGNDTITGGDGADAMTGGIGADTFVIGNVAHFDAGETINGTSEAGTTDTLRLDAAGTYSLTGVTNIDSVVLNVDAANFNVTVANAMVSTANIDGNVTNNDLQISAGVAMTNGVIINASGLTGTNHIVVVGTNLGGADTITGGAGADTIDGGAGNDFITGGAGIDTLTGGDGDDKFVYTTAATLFSGTALVDSITGGNGTDDAIVVDASVAAFTIGATVSFSAGISGVESIKAAGAATNVISVTLNDNAYEAGIHTVDLSADTSATGSNVINVSAESTAANGYTLIGSAGVDTITGGAGADTINAGTGSDTINGGTGNDSLTGGAGFDHFVFAAGDSGQTTGNIDVITDYTSGAVNTGDEFDYGATDLVIGGSNALATATQASINATTGVATFALGEGTTLADALADIAARIDSAGGSDPGEFAFFQVNGTGNFYLYISDTNAGVGTGDVVVELQGITSITSIDLSGSDLSIVAPVAPAGVAGVSDQPRH